MKVALDSNILCADFRLNGGAFQVFLSALSRLGAVCCVPEVVRDEVVALHRRNLEEAARNTQKWSRTWARLTGSPSESSPTAAELDAQTARYAPFLADAFREHSVELLPYPSVSHRAKVRYACGLIRYRCTGNIVDLRIRRRRIWSAGGNSRARRGMRR